MGSACSTQEMKHQYEINRQIERQIRKEENDTMGDQKLLLLGTGECGKSTILKQMHILHKDGFSDQERLALRPIVFSNIMKGMAEVIRARKEFNLDVGSTNTIQEDCGLIVAIVEAGKDTFPFTPEVFQSLLRVWSDSSVQQTFLRRAEFQVGDSLSYFMNDLERIYDAKYLPTPVDVLHTRVPTTGVVQVNFPIKGVTFNVYDVGGQRSERRKWIHLFEDVHAIIYISAISEYDQKLSEDSHTNRLQESIDLFKQICNSKWFTRTSMILFLNKRDLFEEKLRNVPISVFFKDYKGSSAYKDCVDYIRRFYVSLNQERGKKIYVHETCATDTTQVQMVIDSVIDTVIGRNLRGTGMD